jgi:hypothetical protein
MLVILVQYALSAQSLLDGAENDRRRAMNAAIEFAEEACATSQKQTVLQQLHTQFDAHLRAENARLNPHEKTVM